MTPIELRQEATDLDLISFDRNDGYLAKAAKLLFEAADALEEALAHCNQPTTGGTA